VVPGTEQYQATLKGLAFTESTEVRTKVFNEGNLLIRPRGRVKIFDAAGKKLRQTELNPNLLGVLPRTLREITTKLEEPLPSGTYKLKVEVDYGAPVLVVGEHSFEVE